MKSASIPLEDRRFLRKLGTRLRETRVKKGWTLEQAEEHGWPSWQHLQKVEAGKNLTAITLRRIALLYRISLSELFDKL